MKIRKKQVDSKHLIRDPIKNDDPKDLEIWVNTLKKTRIYELFCTEAGLNGHVQQLQSEINRITPGRLDGKPAELVMAAVEASKKIRKALQNAIQAAKDISFNLRREHIIQLPLLNDQLVF